MFMSSNIHSSKTQMGQNWDVLFNRPVTYKLHIHLVYPLILYIHTTKHGTATKMDRWQPIQKHMNLTRIMVTWRTGCLGWVVGSVQMEMTK